MSAYMNEFVSYNVIDDDYVQEKYEGKKNNRLEDIPFVNEEGNVNATTEVKEDKDESVKEEKDESVKEEEIIPLIIQD